MDQIALNWLVYELTGSPVALGWLNFCRLAPIFVFTLIGGVVADRMERRRLMVVSQTVAMVMALILAVLVFAGIVEFWMVLVIAVGRGVMMSFNQPARQSMISDIVPREDLRNAIALNSATLNLTRVLGPTLGGVLIATVGVAGAFFFNAASFLGVLYGLALMRFSERPRQPHGGVMRDLLGGLAYLRQQPTLAALVMLALVPMVFGIPYMTMLTVFAKDVLAVGGAGLGVLAACSGVGAVIGAMFVAASDNLKVRLQSLMLGGLVAFGLTLAIFALSPWFWLSAIALVGVGASQQMYMATNNTLIQTRVAEEYRGRVMSTLFLNRSMVPLGTLLAGFGTAAVGAPYTVAAMAGVLVLLALVAARYTPITDDAD